MEESWPSDPIAPRTRVISDNDYCGDPDGLVQLAHHLLSPSVEIYGVIGSAVAAYDPSWTGNSADESVRAALQIAQLVDRSDVQIVSGSNDALGDRDVAQSSPAAELLIEEAMRDSDLPLFVACGGGLTNIASAWLLEPRIAGRLTLIWIGGQEHLELARPAAPRNLPFGEYNLSIDPLAAQVVFNDSQIDVWQVPVDAYRQVLVSRSELLLRMEPMGLLGAHLFSRIEKMRTSMASWGIQLGETYCLGDSPLVLLTALVSSFDPLPSSSRWVDCPCPIITDDGGYEPGATGRTIRVFTDLDSRLVNEDLYAKLQMAAKGG
jgi:inosine-uridine nucleoside N-ribohydrolase